MAASSALAVSGTLRNRRFNSTYEPSASIGMNGTASRTDQGATRRLALEVARLRGLTLNRGKLTEGIHKGGVSCVPRGGWAPRSVSFADLRKRGRNQFLPDEDPAGHERVQGRFESRDQPFALRQSE